MMGTLNPTDVSTRRQRIAELAKQYPDRALLSLNHHIDGLWLEEAFHQTRKDGALGVDGKSAEDFRAQMPAVFADLENRMKSGSYYAPPGRRSYIPKDDGTQRPISIASFEDKVAQRAIVMVLEPIYEQEFLDFSYGFRPGRRPLDAVHRLFQEVMSMNGCWLIDADVRSYFDSVSKQHLRSFVETRVGDKMIQRMLGKWLKAGVVDDGLVSYPQEGVPQGSVIGPLLSNIYLHEVLDKWFVHTVQPRLRGRAFLIRFADDFVMGFSNERDARSVMAALPKRFARFNLTIHPNKTKLIRFFPSADCGECTSFDFLGFTHHWGKSRKGNWVMRHTTKKHRLSKTIRTIWEVCRKQMHHPLAIQQASLNRRLIGHYQYFGIVGNYRQLNKLYRRARSAWRYWLNRRTRGNPMPWTKFEKLLSRYPLRSPYIPHSPYRSAK